MEQQQFRISFSLGTKLLLSVVTLLLVVIGFLTGSTIVMLTEDKRAYTYQSQGTENVLAGREFVNLSARGLSTLQLILASFDPARELSAADTRAIQSVLDNQSDILLTEVGKISGPDKTFQTVRTFPLEAKLSAAEFTAADMKISEDWWKIIQPALIKDSYYFVNLSKAGHNPLLAIIRADLGYNAQPDTIPVAVGYISLAGFGKEIKGSRVSIANRDGFVLHDSDSTVLFSAANLAKDPIFLKAIQSPTAVGAGEFEDSNSKFLASFFRTDLQLVVTSRTDWRNAMSATYTLTEKFILLGLMCITGAVIFALLFAKNPHRATVCTLSGNAPGGGRKIRP